MDTTKEKLKRIRDYMKYTSMKKFTILPKLSRSDVDYINFNKIKKANKI
jgi:hypothetical protein